MNTNKRNIYLLLIINFLQSLVFYAGISTIYRLESGLKISDIFIIESISWIITFILELPFGKFSDRYGYKITIILGNLMFFTSKIIFYKATTFPHFLLERVILSVAIAALSGSDTALLFESSSNGTKYYGYLRAFSTVGLVIASFIAPILISKNIRLTGLVTIFPYGLAFALSFLLKDNKRIIKNNRQTTFSYFKKIVKNPEMLVFIILTAIITEVSFAVGVVLNQSQYIRCGLNIKYFSIIFAFMQFIPVVSAYTHKLVNSIGKTKIMIITISSIILSCLILALTTNIYLSILSIIIISLASSIFLPLSYNIQNCSLSNKNRATYLSIYAMIMEIVSVVFNIIIGKIADTSLSKTFMFMIITLLIFCFTYIRIKKRTISS